MKPSNLYGSSYWGWLDQRGLAIPFHLQRISNPPAMLTIETNQSAPRATQRTGRKAIRAHGRGKDFGSFPAFNVLR